MLTITRIWTILYLSWWWQWIKNSLLRVYSPNEFYLNLVDSIFHSLLWLEIDGYDCWRFLTMANPNWHYLFMWFNRNSCTMHICLQHRYSPAQRDKHHQSNLTSHRIASFHSQFVTSIVFNLPKNIHISTIEVKLGQFDCYNFFLTIQ